jgi:zinc and cadmium transporter
MACCSGSIAMSALPWIVTATLLGGVLSAALASAFLLLPAARRNAALPQMISFATGAMLAAALLDLLPDALAAAGPAHVQLVGACELAGIGLFFVLEKLVLWRHSHSEDLDEIDQLRRQAAGWIVLFGDGMHNAFDGVLIAAAFLTDVRLGLVTTLAITAHEIPQELGDLAVLLHAGMSPVRAMVFNLASSLTSIIGGLIGYFALRHTLGVLPYAVAVAAASLIYVAVADLIPGLHRRVDLRGGIWQVLLIGAGVAVIVAAQRLLG